MKLPYNPNDKKSIIEFAKQLKGKSLREACDSSIEEHSYLGKGNFGQVLEKFYFQYDPNSSSEADFASVGLELKSSPLKQLKNKEFRSKERLVLNIINYFEIVSQDFETSSFWKKNANLLLVFYLYQAGLNILDYVIKLIDEWNFSNTDLEIIKRDWEIIKQKILEGKAHELSEGDTFYLGACVKGANALTTRNQPFCETPAKQRAFSLKQGYVNHIITSIADEATGIYGKLIPTASLAKKQSLEEIVISKFQPYYGRTINQIVKTIGIRPNKKAKNYFANLTKAIFGVALDKEIEEFAKADIEIKSVRVEPDDRIIESISFKQFKYIELVKEDWDTSGFKDILEHKFLFIFFKKMNGERILQKVKFWNMPYPDIEHAKKVWLHTKQLVEEGNIVKKVKPNGERITYFPSKKDNPVSHVRPHAKNALDTHPLPTKDNLTNTLEYTKHSFWLNNTYVRNEIYLK